MELPAQVHWELRRGASAGLAEQPAHGEAARGARVPGLRVRGLGDAVARVVQEPPQRRAVPKDLFCRKERKEEERKE